MRKNVIQETTFKNSIWDPEEDSNLIKSML